MSTYQISTSENNRLVYMLENAYSEANFGIEALKGKDQHRARYLVDTAKLHNVCVYFAHFEYARCGGCEDDDPYDHHRGVDIHEIIDEIESKLEVGYAFHARWCRFYGVHRAG